jgi:hypothetical protein
MQITPTISWSFNLDGRSFTHDREVAPHRTVHHAADPAPSSSAPPRDRGMSQLMSSATTDMDPQRTPTEELA